ncbi:hypothetical protein BDB00DRAFT_281281 [Zychaea mexicana]|uniref:uncharacterized protein n=1 Tax=Zychaea mexicana TaxID=64656 RepID=UPI0022FDC357|nr:uncharacterized protein BDB00DRAFT_281281 [Zychaea mexicana]KAI9494979.1 hypothetical protein BDB00DRAFT_281281 [Zychaea mexicana]
MSYLDFTNQRIDESFRKLCSKVYFKAEAQQIDRILEAFACRYLEYVIHAVAMALVLLNTDLHGVHDNHKKMSRAKFITNTMTTIRDVMTMTTPEKPTIRNSVTGAVAITNDNSSSSSFTNDNGNNKAARRRTLLSLSESVLSALTSASNGSSRWMIRRSMSSKSVNSIPSPGTLTTHNEAHRQQPSSSKQNWVVSNNNEIDNSNNDTEQQNSSTNNTRFGLIDEQRSWSEDMENLLKDLYISVKGNQIIQNNRMKRASASTHDQTDRNTASPSSNNIDSSSSNKALLRRRRGQSLLLPLAGLSGALDDISLLKQKRRLSHSPTDPSIYALDNRGCEATNITTSSTGSPNIRMRKEGIVMQKHIMEHATKKARHRAWQPCFLVVHGGKADLCRPPPSSSATAKEQKRKSIWGGYSHTIHDSYYEREQNILCASTGSSSNNNNNSAKRTEKDRRAALVQTIDLKHSIANTLPPPGWHGGRRHVFSLQTADGAVWLFESVDAESTVAWVTCCNYWAALLSKEAMPGAICNLDYGWWHSSNIGNSFVYNNSDSNNDSSGADNSSNTNIDCSIDIVISDWTPPSPSMIASQLSETEKTIVLKKHIAFLQQEIKDHRAVRESIYKRVHLLVIFLYRFQQPHTVFLLTFAEFCL